MKPIIQRHFITAVLLTLCCCVANAQSLELKDLNIPNAPAFTILDHTPAVIDKPGTAKAFTANVVSLLGESQGLPKNFAIEVAPFWLFKNRLNVYKYHGIDTATKKQTNIFANLRNASLSVGSVYRDSGKTQPFDANYLAIGGRVNLIKIIRKPTIEATLTTINAIAKRQVNLVAPVTATCAGAHVVNSPEYKACIKKGLEAAFNKDSMGVGLYEDRLQKILDIRPLFQMDVAFAGSWAFKDNTMSNDHGYRTGIWTTMAFSLPLCNAKDIEAMINNTDYINLYGTLRYIKEDSTLEFKKFIRQELLDMGGRIEAEFKKFSISFESIYRVNSNNTSMNTSRNVGIVQYKVNEHLFLTATFGKNFGTVRNVIALFGLNFGFGKQSLIQTP